MRSFRALDFETQNEMQNIQTQMNFSEKPQQQACFITDVSGSDFLLTVQAALDLAYEAGKWEGQVELEEHYDREQYSHVLTEAINSRKTSSPTELASCGNTVTINLRSQVWRDGVRKSAKEYLKKAMLLVKKS